MKKILVAGASGKLGQLVVHRLKEDGYWVRVLSRNIDRWEALRIPVDDIKIADITSTKSIENSCNGIDAVISCAGASMDIKNISDRQTFTAVDFEGNNNLLNDAKRSGVNKFVYVSVSSSERMLETEYCRAHYQFEQSLGASGMRFTIVKPTGFFYFLREIFSMAEIGTGIVFGDGSNRTNPVHEQDVADACIEALESEQTEIVIGGPEVYTRKQVVELAFAINRKKPFIIKISPKIFTFLIFPMKFINRRVYALLEFGGVVSVTDVVAPSKGKRNLKEYFQSLL